MAKKRLLFINPPSGFLIDERIFLPLGIASVAGYARNQGHDVDLLDLKSKEDYISRVLAAIRINNYDVVGITATSPQFYYASKINQEIKTSFPGVKRIIGGPHASMFSALRNRLITKFMKEGINGRGLEERLYEEDLNFKSLEEFNVIAEGEEGSIVKAINNEGKKWVYGGVMDNIDSLALPARDLFDFNDYLKDEQGNPKFQIVGGLPSGSLISQRGCPYQCEFCCGRDSIMYKQVRMPKTGMLRVHSPKRVLEELDEMHEKYGLKTFMFYDDEFNLHPQRTINLCCELKKRDYKFRGFIKSDLIVKHSEVATAMKEAGFLEVLSGIESGSERILNNHLHKKTSPEINYRAAMICLENGIGFKALTMLGHVSETPRDAMDTRDWIIKIGKEYNNKLGPGFFTFDLTVFQPYAGCPIWDKAERNRGEFSDEYKWVYYSRNKNGIVDPKYGGLYFNKLDFSTEHGFYKGIPGTYKSFIRTKYISSEQYIALRDAIEWEIRDRLDMKQLVPDASAQFDHVMGQSGKN